MVRPTRRQEVFPEVLTASSSARPPSPHPHQPALGSPPREGVGAALPGAQEEYVARDAREDSGCAATPGS